MERTLRGAAGLPPVEDDQPISRIFDILPIKTGDFTMKELRRAIKLTQENNATGLDGIPADIWKPECINDQFF